MSAFLEQLPYARHCNSVVEGGGATQKTRMWFLPSKRCWHTVKAVEISVNIQSKRFFLFGGVQHERGDL